MSLFAGLAVMAAAFMVALGDPKIAETFIECHMSLGRTREQARRRLAEDRFLNGFAAVMCCGTSLLAGMVP
jgi:hypothetical protein